MKLNLTRPLAFFDLETTGTDISKDRIVEISIVKVMPNGDKDSKTRRINPGMPIPKEASAVHHIYDEDVKDCPLFKAIAKSLSDFLIGCDIAGFNSDRFDIPLLAEEFLRAEIDFDISDRKTVDVQNLFHKMEQRTLAAAYLFYCNKPIENAHNALADTTATWEVLKAQISKYDILEKNIDFLSDFSKAGNYNLLDFAGRLAINEEGEGMYNFGKNKGKTIREISISEPGYYGWMLNADFPLYTKQCLKNEMEKIKKEQVKEQNINKERKKINNVTTKIENESIEDKLEALKNKFK